VSDPIRHNPAILPPGVGGPALRPASRPAQMAEPAVPFGDVLAGQLGRPDGIRFSGHALQRLERRGIELDQATATRLNQGVDRAAAKGSRDALVLVDGTAFVVSIANRTVITAVDPAHMKERVFTNIDSAVIS
jgi:flagellar operon protein